MAEEKSSVDMYKWLNIWGLGSVGAREVKKAGLTGAEFLASSAEAMYGEMGAKDGYITHVLDVSGATQGHLIALEAYNSLSEEEKKGKNPPITINEYGLKGLQELGGAMQLYDAKRYAVMSEMTIGQLKQYYETPEGELILDIPENVIKIIDNSKGEKYGELINNKDALKQGVAYILSEMDRYKIYGQLHAVVVQRDVERNAHVFGSKLEQILKGKSPKPTPNDKGNFQSKYNTKGPKKDNPSSKYKTRNEDSKSQDTSGSPKNKTNSNRKYTPSPTSDDKGSSKESPKQDNPEPRSPSPSGSGIENDLGEKEQSDSLNAIFEEVMDNIFDMYKNSGKANSTKSKQQKSKGPKPRGPTPSGNSANSGFADFYAKYADNNQMHSEKPSSSKIFKQPKFNKRDIENAEDAEFEYVSNDSQEQKTRKPDPSGKGLETEVKDNGIEIVENITGAVYNGGYVEERSDKERIRAKQNAYDFKMKRINAGKDTIVEDRGLDADGVPYIVTQSDIDKQKHLPRRRRKPKN